MPKNSRSSGCRKAGSGFGEITGRQPRDEAFDPSLGRREVRIDAKGMQTILYGDQAIDLSYLEQLVEPGQLRAIGRLIHLYESKYLKES